MGSLVLTEAKSSRFGTETKMVSKIFRSDRDCPGFRRTTCEGRGPNFLFIFPTCGRERPYTVPGKCDLVPDTLCHIGNFVGGRNRCNDGSRCADCLASQDCPGGQMINIEKMKTLRIIFYIYTRSLGARWAPTSSWRP